ncbi:MAG TPA: PepSY-associated TM helix domain-containing protein, partial [Polyangiaceae bacterium]
MTPSTTRRLLALHRWCGLLVSANLLVLALTGLILIFHDEIDAALGVMPEARAGAASITISGALALANGTNPRAKPVFLFQDQAEHPGLVFVGLSEGTRRLADAKPVAVDLREGQVFKDLNLEGSFTGIVLKLHSELLAGPAGRLLVGLVALAFLVSLISGAIVYGPTMKKFSFGLLRRDKSRRTRFADLHKLLGAASLGWTFVVAGTGLMLSLGSVLLQLYSVTELAALGAPYAHEPIVTDLNTVDQAVAQAERGAPGRHWSIVALPGSDLASPRH